MVIRQFETILYNFNHKQDNDTDQSKLDTVDIKKEGQIVTLDDSDSKTSHLLTSSLENNNEDGLDIGPRTSNMDEILDNMSISTDNTTLLDNFFKDSPINKRLHIETINEIKCWGDNTHKQLDIPSNSMESLDFALGSSHACLLTYTGI